MISQSILGLLVLGTINAVKLKPFEGPIATTVDVTDYPFQLSLQKADQHICGASIIASNWALTAASCVALTAPNLITFRAGSAFVEKDGSVHKARKIYLHPDYEGNDWDFALVKVQPSFPLSSPDAKAIKITNDEPAPGTPTTIAGWGTLINESFPVQLQAVNLTIMSRTNCNTEFSGAATVTDRMICTGDKDKSFCAGDNGGPLVSLNTNELVGIASWGDGCPAFPAVYSNVAFPDVRTWIQDIVRV